MKTKVDCFLGAHQTRYEKYFDEPLQSKFTCEGEQYIYVDGRQTSKTKKGKYGETKSELLPKTVAPFRFLASASHTVTTNDDGIQTTVSMVRVSTALSAVSMHSNDETRAESTKTIQETHERKSDERKLS